MSAEPTDPGELELVADCSRCFGLCCVLLPFSADSGFGVDKAGGVPCLNLLTDDRCGIHADLREQGWAGCTTFDCFGAGQQVSQVTYGGVSWREGGNRGEMAAVLTVMRLLHEMLAHLGEAATRVPDPRVVVRRAEVRGLVDGTPDQLLALDLDGLLETVGDLLAEVSREVRGRGADLRGADLAGTDLRQRALRAADLRRAVLIAADLRGVDLTDADLLGADLRDADLTGADARGALFLSQAQANGAKGDLGTLIPERLTRPSHWR